MESKFETTSVNNILDLPNKILEHILSSLIGDFFSVQAARGVNKRWRYIINRLVKEGTLPDPLLQLYHIRWEDGSWGLYSDNTYWSVSFPISAHWIVHGHFARCKKIEKNETRKNRTSNQQLEETGTSLIQAQLRCLLFYLSILVLITIQ